MARWVISVVVVSAVLASWSLAQEPDEPAAGMAVDRQIDELEQQIEELDWQAAAAAGDQQLDAIERQMEELERKQMELEEMAERIHAFAEVKEDARLRLAELNAELRELEQEQAETEEAPAGVQDLQSARMNHVRQAIEMTSKIAALEKPAELPRATALLRELDLLEMKWNIVLEPRLVGALELAEMENEAAELGNPPQLVALVEEARALHEKAAKDAATLYDLWVAQVKAREEFGQRVEKFWRDLDRHEASADEGEEEPAD
jgi:myosin heavy subunit